MKSLLILIAIQLTSLHSFAALVHSAKLDAEHKNILIDVSYAGGCGKHDFSLKFDGCLETYPVQCKTQLVDKTEDHCEALIFTTIAIPLNQSQLEDPYYKGASLTIFGDRDFQTNTTSSATVTLP